MTSEENRNKGLTWLNGQLTNQTNVLLSQYKIGDRIEAAPHTNSWMMGDRYGEIVKIGRFYLHVKMDRSGKTRKFVPENVLGKVQ